MLKVLLTGANGFLGQYINDHLIEKGYVVETIGRGVGNSISCDLSLQGPQLSDCPDLVIHCAGKAHFIPKSENEKKEFFDINVIGTKNLLNSLEQMPTRLKSFVFISSVAVYGKDEGSEINEETPLLANDPYGLSKIQAEHLILSWCKRKGVICTILRLPLLVGVNPPGNLGAMINGINRGYYFDVAGGRARKSVVLAEDVAMILPQVARIGGVYNLTDRYHPSFSELSSNIARQLGKKQPLNLPMWITKLMAKFGDFLGKYAPINSKKLDKITSDLTFDDQNAVNAFNWNPKPVLKGLKIN
ncbi:NAD-dependent epimerase/dehydratase family protein [Pedobacter sp. MC2016-24]|uniref:NAD-dependent epimerase/dehydratase family protein n=1 Tax=Pedobacter sp. MC2016-24 TaxID=2780090 RepID=UPI001881CB2B|nr:NAD-dependent epimerase/dehydratase family protein [Pedobacter sp. MC2016-24]MBE9600305.1 NAD-dependent epimerase/dehydratase family protein [Pedobacter sp. MC2016-24]